MYSSELIDGITYIHMTQSLQKNFVFKGETKETCYFKVKKEVVDREYSDPTESMEKGIYFETLCLGSGARGNLIKDLKRLQTGAKSIDQKRIESQAIEFKKDVRHYMLDINPDTTQKTFAKVWRGLEKYGVIVIFTGELDILSPIKYRNEYYPLSCIDLKLTKNIASVYGDFSWGDPESMDHTQAYAYTWITNLIFFYMVYDYNPQLRKKIFRVNTNNLIMTEFFEALRKATAEYIHAETKNWKKNPSLGLCKKCKVTECEYYNTEQETIN